MGLGFFFLYEILPQAIGNSCFQIQAWHWGGGDTTLCRDRGCHG